MPSKKKVGSLGLKNLSHEFNEDDGITLIYCKTCCNYYPFVNSNDGIGSRH